MYISICHFNMYSVILIPTRIVIYKQLYSCSTTVVTGQRALRTTNIHLWNWLRKEELDFF